MRDGQSAIAAAAASVTLRRFFRIVRATCIDCALLGSFTTVNPCVAQGFKQALLRVFYSGRFASAACACA
jgi:hypothetical protein